MNFSLKPVIIDCETLGDFFGGWDVGHEDLMITSEHVMGPVLGNRPAPCDVLYQERFGAGEPSDVVVDAMLAAVKGRTYGRVIAVGGGAVIDIAKLFVFGDGLSCEEIFARGASLPRKRILVAVPTTCGTGSEVTGISIVEFKEKGTKLGLAVPALFPDAAVLIPSALRSLPYEVFASSSIDALIHAVESHVSPKANVFTRALGRTAMEDILRGYRALADQAGERKLPENLDAYLSASTMAGIAFANAGVGAVHALSYPIGGNWHVPHGKANYMVFREVMAEYVALGADLRVLEEVLSGALDCERGDVWGRLSALLDAILTRQSLRELGADEAKCVEMAASVLQNQQRLLANNPVPLAEERIAAIYRRCL